VCLTLYICLAGLALGVERVEGKVEVMLGRLTSRRVPPAAAGLRAGGKVQACGFPPVSRR
jgi:hypothetical protein